MERDRQPRTDLPDPPALGAGKGPGMPRACHGEVSRWFGLLAAHDPASAMHSLRVERYAGWIAVDLALDGRTRVAVALAARLHDTGKIAVPQAVLQHPGRLTAEGHQLIRAHPVLSERIVHAIIPDPLVAAAVRSHHERVDGTGYPDGLAGARIPLMARILAVADAFDAMTSSRPYREPVAIPLALDQLHRVAGTQVDPEIVAALGRALRRHRPGATAGALLSVWAEKDL